MIPPCLTLSIIRYGSRVKWSNPGNGVAPSSTPWCSSYRKGSLRVTSTMIANFTFYLLLQMFRARGANLLCEIWILLVLFFPIDGYILNKPCRCGIGLWYAMEHASVILCLFLSWMKLNVAEFRKSREWLVKILRETKEFVVTPVLKSFFMFIDSFV